ncbi:MAG: TIM barrel protein, partial [Actinomycetota bacterium]
MRFGAHVPTRGHPARALEAALEIGGEALQIFISNPRGWAPPTVTTESAREFRERRAETGLGPVFVHASYLVNIASPRDEFRTRAVDLARRELGAAAAIGADGFVVHAGSGGTESREAALERAVASCHSILAATDGPELLLELTAGGAGSVASTIPQAAELLDALGRHPRIALCLDTCHL